MQPNVPNVIPGKIEFYVDIRDVEEEGKSLVSEQMIKKIEKVADEYGLRHDVQLLGESSSVKLLEEVINAIEEAVIKKGYPYKVMNSGAVHDSAMLSELTKVAMIFVPSKDGRSHCPKESTNFEDIKLGCDVLLEAVINLAIR